jgi:nitrogen fixation protein NifB
MNNTINGGLIIPLKKGTHPCFDVEAKKKYGRVHLPVAPKCNVQCNYCNRRYDCVNESRPGVCSAVLAPSQALDYLRQILKKDIDISVIGIAGPGDPLANPDEVFETIELAKHEFPHLHFCLSTNGIEIPKYINKLTELGISHVTLTINAVQTEILANIYSWVRYDKHIYRGPEAGKLVFEKQMEALRLLKEHNIVVKVNSIVLPGYNDHHMAEIAEKVASLGADIMNCIPVYPNRETAFEDIPEPSKQKMVDILKSVSKYIKPMGHCTRCRADAAGLLGYDIVDSVTLLQECASKPLYVTKNKPFVAVASHEGMLVNQHLGEVREFLIYAETTNGYTIIDKREAPLPGSGDMRWIQLAKTLKDCNTVLVSGAGSNPGSMLKSMGLQIIQMNGLIEIGLDAVYKGKTLAGYKSISFKCGESCEGNGQGC